MLPSAWSVDIPLEKICDILAGKGIDPGKQIVIYSVCGGPSTYLWFALTQRSGDQVADLTEEVEPLVFVASSAAPDFSIFEVTPSTLYPQEGEEPLSVFVMIMNNGPDFAG